MRHEASMVQLDLQQDDGESDEAVPREVGLEWSLVWEGISRQSLLLQTVKETEVGEEDTPPCDDTGNGGDIVQPVENGHSGLSSGVEVGEESKCASDQNTPDWQSFLRTSSEDSGDLSVECQSVECSTGSIEIRVSSRPSCEQNDGVDNRR